MELCDGGTVGDFPSGKKKKKIFFKQFFLFNIEKENRKQNRREMAVTNNYLLIFFWCNDFHCMYGFIFDMFGLLKKPENKLNF